MSKRSWLGKVWTAARRGGGCQLILWSLVVGVWSAACEEAIPQDPDRVIREIMVPEGDLPMLLAASESIFLSRGEWERLKAQVGEDPGQTTPYAGQWLQSEYTIEIEEGRAKIVAEMVLDVLRSGGQFVSMPVSELGLMRVDLDGQPAVLGRENGMRLYVSGIGKHSVQVEWMVPMITALAQQTLQATVPQTASQTYRMSVPGNVEIKQGAAVLERRYDAVEARTHFQLLPPPGPLAITLSLNNKIRQEERLVAARAVLVDEVTEAYEKLHVSVAMTPLHGTVDRFDFAIPEGFEVAEVQSPQLMRWLVSEEDGLRTLQVHLGEGTSERTIWNLVLVRSQVPLGAWKWPDFRPLHVTSSLSVWGQLLAANLKLSDVRETSLIPIAYESFLTAIPASLLRVDPGSPKLRATGAYYATHDKASWEGVLVQPTAEVEMASQSMLTVGRAGLQWRSQLTLIPRRDKLFGLEFSVPVGWDVARVQVGGGEPQKPEVYRMEKEWRYRLPFGTPLEAEVPTSIAIDASAIPPGWMDGWEEQRLDFPRLVVPHAKSVRTIVGVTGRDDLAVAPGELEGVAPIFASERSQLGLGEVSDALLMRSLEETWHMGVVIQSQKPILSSHTFAFHKVQSRGLASHYEMSIEVKRSRTGSLRIAFPLAGPSEIAIRGMGQTLIKETQQQIRGDERVWEVALAEPQRGNIRLAIDFVSPLPVGRGALWNPRLLDAVFQSSTVGIEGDGDHELQIVRRDLEGEGGSRIHAVDVGELVDAEYQMGNRIVGVYEVLGHEEPLELEVTPRVLQALPTAIVERAELTSILGVGGVVQSAARYLLRARGQYLELELPEGCELWSVLVDQQPALVQRDGERTLVELAPRGEDGSRGVGGLIDMQVVFQSRKSAGWGRRWLDLVSPRLWMLNGAGFAEGRQEVPVSELQWGLYYSKQEELVFRGGNVMPVSRRRREIEWTQGWGGWLWGGATHDESQKFPLMMMMSDSEMGQADFDAAGKSPAPTSPAILPPMAEEKRNEPTLPQVEAKDALGFARQMEGQSKTEPKKEGGMNDGELQKENAADAMDGSNRLRERGEMPFQGGVRARTWAMEGVRSLPFTIENGGYEVQRFQSLGNAATVRVAVYAKENRVWMRWGTMAVVLGMGCVWVWGQSKRVGGFLLVGMTISLIGASLAPREWLLDPFVEGLWDAMVVMLGVVVLKCVVSSPKGQGWSSRVRGKVPVILGWLTGWLLVIACSNGAWAQGNDERKGVEPTKIAIPEGAIVVPFDPKKPRSSAERQDVLVPLKVYQAWLEKSLRAQGPADARGESGYGLQVAGYEGRLEDGDSLTVIGEMGVETWRAGVEIPLGMESGVLEEVLLNGETATLREVVQGEGQEHAIAVPRFQLHVAEPGAHRLRFKVRFPIGKQGGWRTVEGRVPVGVAGGVEWSVGANTEIRVGNAGEESEISVAESGGVVAAPLGVDGTLRVRWRAQMEHQAADQGLTIESLNLLDVQEEGLRWVWQMECDTRRGVRDQVELQVPREWIIERVVGANVRGWSRGTGEGAERLDVRWLKATSGKELFTVVAYRPWDWSGESQTVPLKLGSVPGAILDRGTLILRRSGRKSVAMQSLSGLQRIELPTGWEKLTQHSESGPVPLQPFQAFHYASANWESGLVVAPIVSEQRLENRMVLRVTSEGATLEGNAIIEVKGEPLHRLGLSLPVGWEMESPRSRVGVEWSITEEAGRVRMEVRFAAPIVERTEFHWRATWKGSGGGQESDGSGNAFRLTLPRVEYVGVREQWGQFAIQTDPGYDVRVEDLVGCRVELPESVAAWIQADQRGLVRSVIRYEGGQYSANLERRSRTPVVQAQSYSNLRVTDRYVEETVLMDWTIREAGASRFQFLLPVWMKEAEIRSPLMRRVQREVVQREEGEAVRITLDLQEEILGTLRVLVLHDRAKESRLADLVLPVIETGEVLAQFVTCENGSRDELQVEGLKGLVAMDRQQSAWRRLNQMFGMRLNEAYQAAGESGRRSLQFQTRERSVVETVAASIGIATTWLVLDDSGALRAKQEYRMENRTESHVEIQVPEGCQVWSVQVAGMPVKPMVGSASNRWRIPLIRTGEGDLDYGVEIYYGGTLARPSLFRRTRFPFLKTINIRVESSQVRLYLPETRKWFGFGGTMGAAQSEEELTKGWLDFKTKQVDSLSSLLRSESSRGYSKARAAVNLQQLNQQLGQSVNAASVPQSGEKVLEQSWRANSMALQKAQGLLDELQASQAKQELSYNRDALVQWCEIQQNDRGRNVVQGVGNNFQEAASQAVVGSVFDEDWFQRQGIVVESRDKQVQDQGRIQSQNADVAQLQGLIETLGKTPQVKGGHVLEEGLAEDGPKPMQSRSVDDGGDAKMKALRYQQRLQGQNEALLGNQVAQGGGGNRLSELSEDEVLGRRSGDLNDRVALGVEIPNTTGGKPGGNGSPLAGGGGRGSGGGQFGRGVEALRGGEAMVQGQRAFRSGANLSQGMGGGQVVGGSGRGESGLVSLPGNLATQGEVHRFSTPGGEIELTVYSVTWEGLEQLGTLAIRATGLVVGAWFLWMLGRGWERNRRLMVGLLIGIGVVSLVMSWTFSGGPVLIALGLLAAVRGLIRFEPVGT